MVKMMKMTDDRRSNSSNFLRRSAEIVGENVVENKTRRSAEEASRAEATGRLSAAPQREGGNSHAARAKWGISDANFPDNSMISHHKSWRDRRGGRVSLKKKEEETGAIPISAEQRTTSITA